MFSHSVFHLSSSQSQIYLPRELLASKGLDEYTILQGAKSERELKSFHDCIFEVASQAHGHLEEAQKLKYVDNAIYAMFPGIRSQLYLDALRRVDFDPAHPDLMQVQQSHLKYQWKLMQSSVMKKI
jgi:phytoene/squalene synthetase